MTDWIERDTMTPQDVYRDAPTRQVEEKVLPAAVMDPIASEFWRAREIISDITGAEGSTGLHNDGGVRMTIGEYRRLARSLRGERAEIGRLRRWAEDAASAIDAASIIGQKRLPDGIGLNYGDHDRLLRAASDMLGTLPYRSVEASQDSEPAS